MKRKRIREDRWLQRKKERRNRVQTRETKKRKETLKWVVRACG